MSKKILVEVSARHIHLDQKNYGDTFRRGSMSLQKSAGFQCPPNLHVRKRVDVIGPKRTISNVGILGPLRFQNAGGSIALPTAIRLDRWHLYAFQVIREIHPE